MDIVKAKCKIQHQRLQSSSVKIQV
uniref:Uncharacterized protein n=1 Tax=Arundo donax TaxID=35708 RepID=A0A0A9CB68_ARUDO